MATLLAAVGATGLLSLPIIYRDSLVLHPFRQNATVTSHCFKETPTVQQLRVPYYPSSSSKDNDTPKYLSAVIVRPEQKNCILFCSGNGANKRYFTNIVDSLLDIFPHHSIVMFDYEGFGDSYGNKATIYGLFESTLTMYRYIKQNILQSSTQGLTVFGQSVGTGSGCSILPYMQTQDRLILQNGFSSLRRMMESYVPWPFSWMYGSFLEDDFNNVKQIRTKNEAKVPIMALHCKNDQVVPYKIGEELAVYCHEFIPLQGGHNGPIYSESVRGEMRRFLKMIAV